MHLGFSLLTLFPDRVGGSETYVRGLLAEFARGNGPERVSALANRHVMAAYADRVGGPVALRPVRSYRAGDSNATRALAMAFARAAPRVAARDVPAGLDVVHHPLTVPIPATAAPTVTTIHDLQHHDLPGFFSRAELALRRWAYDGAARAADAVVAVSAHTRDGLVRHLGIDEAKVHVIHSGIDHARFRPGPVEGDAALLAPLGLPDRFVLYPANMWPHKNHRLLVEGFARASDRSVALVLTGQTHGRLGALTARARELGVADRVSHVGFVSFDALAALYRRATALAFPSLFEGFGTPPLEAMACGCPVASSTRGSLAETGGDAVVPFVPEDAGDIAAALDRVLGDEELRARLREAGLAQAASFTWERAARAHTELYRRVGSQSSPRRTRS